MVAKQVQGIQALSGNRFDFGIGISPWEEDFAVCGVPWEKRGKRFDEQIDILRGLETGDYFGYAGEMHNMPANKMNPVPTQPTPLLIGGHTEPALKRAARVGDGWMCAGASIEELEAYIGRINQLAHMSTALLTGLSGYLPPGRTHSRPRALKSWKVSG